MRFISENSEKASGTPGQVVEIKEIHIEKF